MQWREFWENRWWSDNLETSGVLCAGIKPVLILSLAPEWEFLVVKMQGQDSYIFSPENFTLFFIPISGYGWKLNLEMYVASLFKTT